MLYLEGNRSCGEDQTWKRDKEKSKLIEDFDEFNESETVIWVFRIITIVLWVYLGKNVIFGSILFFIFNPIKPSKGADTIPKVR